MDEGGHLKSPSAPPTVRQVYALARALCDKASEEFPATREQASEVIERLRRELGHPAPRLEDTPRRRPRGTARRGRGANTFAAAVASRVAEELR
jgi:hypothetical protein